MQYYIKTFGCQMNVYDSGRIANILQSLGYKEAERIEEADLVIFNTCHIREKAAEKVFSDLGRLNLIREERENQDKKTIIGVVGCVVQAEDEQIWKRAPFVDFALGPLTYHRLPEILAKIKRKQGDFVIDTEFPVEAKFDYLPENTSTTSCSYLAIQEGCDNFCTYCVVPYTRGAEYSRPVEDVLKEAQRLIDSGSIEINLLGQNVNSYHGEDKNGKERGYLHLPVQSGSDKILKSMNRRHTSGDYLKIVEKLYKANPNLRMSSDFIVGFPGETDEDFEATLNIVNQVKYIQAFSFKYSRRPGTPAALMPNQVEEKIKKERLEILQDLLFNYQNQFNQSCIGKTMPVLFESQGRHKGQLIGRTPYMQNLHANIPADQLNKIVNVKITAATTNSLSGKMEGA